MAENSLELQFLVKAEEALREYRKLKEAQDAQVQSADEMAASAKRVGAASKSMEKDLDSSAKKVDNLSKSMDAEAKAAEKAATKTKEAAEQISDIAKAEQAAEQMMKLAEGTVAAGEALGISTKNLQGMVRGAAEATAAIGKLNAIGISMKSTWKDATGTMAGTIGTVNLVTQTFRTFYNGTLQVKAGLSALGVDVKAFDSWVQDSLQGWGDWIASIGQAEKGTLAAGAAEKVLADASRIAGREIKNLSEAHKIRRDAAHADIEAAKEQAKLFDKFGLVSVPELTAASKDLGDVMSALTKEGKSEAEAYDLLADKFDALDKMKQRLAKGSVPELTQRLLELRQEYQKVGETAEEVTSEAAQKFDELLGQMDDSTRTMVESTVGSIKDISDEFKVALAEDALGAKAFMEQEQAARDAEEQLKATAEAIEEEGDAAEKAAPKKERLADAEGKAADAADDLFGAASRSGTMISRTADGGEAARMKDPNFDPTETFPEEFLAPGRAITQEIMAQQAIQKVMGGGGGGGNAAGGGGGGSPIDVRAAERAAFSGRGIGSKARGRMSHEFLRLHGLGRRGITASQMGSQVRQGQSGPDIGSIGPPTHKGESGVSSGKGTDSFHGKIGEGGEADPRQGGGGGGNRGRGGSSLGSDHPGGLISPLSGDTFTESDIGLGGSQARASRDRAGNYSGGVKEAGARIGGDHARRMIDAAKQSDLQSRLDNAAAGVPELGPLNAPVTALDRGAMSLLGVAKGDTGAQLNTLIDAVTGLARIFQGGRD